MGDERRQRWHEIKALGPAGLRVPDTEGDAVHRWLLLARVPAVLHGAKECASILEAEGSDEPGAGQVSDRGATKTRLACCKSLGASIDVGDDLFASAGVA